MCHSIYMYTYISTIKLQVIQILHYTINVLANICYCNLTWRRNFCKTQRKFGRQVYTLFGWYSSQICRNLVFLDCQTNAKQTFLKLVLCLRMMIQIQMNKLNHNHYSNKKKYWGNWYSIISFLIFFHSFVE